MSSDLADTERVGGVPRRGFYVFQVYATAALRRICTANTSHVAATAGFGRRSATSRGASSSPQSTRYEAGRAPVRH